jgi:hypothetical protein
MKRRSFFGAMAAAGIGGKKVASNVLDEIVETSSLGGYIGGGEECAQVGASMDYITSLQGQAAKMAALKTVGIPAVVRDYFRDWNGAPEVNGDPQIADAIRSLLNKEDNANG